MIEQGLLFFSRVEHAVFHSRFVKHPAIICIVVARDMTVPMVLAEAATLVVTAAAYGVMRLVKR